MAWMLERKKSKSHERVCRVFVLVYTEAVRTDVYVKL